MQKEIARLSVQVAMVMKDYAALGMDDCYEVNLLLKEAMEKISDHLSESNQLRFADWLLSQI